MDAAKDSWTSFCRRLGDSLFPSRCALCGALGPAAICETCESEMRRGDGWIPMDGMPLDYHASIFVYDGRAAQAVKRLKYKRATSLVPVLAARMAQSWRDLRLEADLVAPVPIHWSRRRYRGFNQSELLAEGLPNVRDVLERTRRTRPQVGLAREERLRNLEGAFAVRGDVRGMHVALVDDVFTSGATARECARALKDAGAVEVGVFTLCSDRAS